jgi:hypothetical protein
VEQGIAICRVTGQLDFRSNEVADKFQTEERLGVRHQGSDSAIGIEVVAEIVGEVPLH